MKSKGWFLFPAVLIALHLALLVTTQFTAWPEMLFWPYLILKGWLPYRDIGIAHSPLLVVELTAFYNFFGVGIWQQKLFSWLIPLLTDGLLLYFFSKLFGIKKALLALVFYVLFQVYYDGNGIWFDHVLAIFSLMIFYFLEKKNHFLVGLFWALAFLTKQTALWFSLPIFYYFLNSSKKKEFCSKLLQGSLPIILLFVLLLLMFGLQRHFYNWALLFGILKLPSQASQIRWPGGRELAISLTPFLLFIPLFFSKLKQKPSGIFLLSIAGMMGAIPRFELFHFQPALPFLALGGASLIIYFLESKKSYFSYLSLSIIVLILATTGRGIARKFFKEDRFYTGNDQKVIGLVSGLTNPGQAIFVTNYWDNLYPLTDTIPAIRPFIPQLTQYLSQPGLEDENVGDLVGDPPKIIVRGQFSTAGDPFRFEKINIFIDNNYQGVDSIGGIDILQTKQK